MQISALILRASAALALLAACGGQPVSETPAQATTPPLGWQQVTSLRVLCLVQPETHRDARALQAEICAAATRLAAAASPFPVTAVGFGDPAVLDPTTATLLVHGSIDPDGEGRLLAFDLRVFRTGGTQNATLFGARPRALRLGASGPAGTALEAPLAAALDEILPWRQRH